MFSGNRIAGIAERFVRCTDCLGGIVCGVGAQGV